MRVIVGVSGGIAAYKACEVIRRFKELGHSVRVIPTPSALKFVGAATFEALSGEPVSSTVWERVDEVAHVALGQGADLIVVVPATANTISRFSQGSADDLLTSTLLVTRAPILLAPAMHTEMWENASTQENIATLKRRGVHVLEPAHGRLTGSDSGVGRLPEPIQIVERALSLVLPQDFAGKAFMITTGGTRERIDPVRYVGNNSSGKQGIALARAAAARGATVTLIAANVESNLLDSLDPKIQIHRVI
ncbi:MAG: bifunctional phosphopantothenoylcysteine decarboxylase/phosphopantothenate--cysteine ligase CoaBC, partial [Actinomycetes bacterium]